MSYEDYPKYQYFYDVTAKTYKKRKYYRVEIFINQAPSPECDRAGRSLRWVGTKFFWLDDHNEPYDAATDWGIEMTKKLDKLQDPAPKQEFFNPELYKD